MPYPSVRDFPAGAGTGTAAWRTASEIGKSPLFPDARGGSISIGGALPSWRILNGCAGKPPRSPAALRSAAEYAGQKRFSDICFAVIHCASPIICRVVNALCAVGALALHPIKSCRNVGKCFISIHLPVFVALMLCNRSIPPNRNMIY